MERSREIRQKCDWELEFTGNDRVSFDLEKDNLETIINLVKNFPMMHINFKTNYGGKNNAYGIGATREVFKLISREMANTIFRKKNNFNVDINDSDPFWLKENFVKDLSNLFYLMIAYDFVLPYHLPFDLLEAITNSVTSEEMIREHAKRINPEAYQSAAGVDVKDFESLDSGYETHLEFYRSLVIDDTLNRKELYDSFYQELGTKLEPLKCTVKELDYVLSGDYQLDRKAVFNNFTIRIGDEVQLDVTTVSLMWREYIEGLSEEHLYQLLITLTNTVSLSKPYMISISKMKLDIKISTCTRMAHINEYFFAKMDNLNSLTKYFVVEDTIVETYNNARSNDFLAQPSITHYETAYRRYINSFNLAQLENQAANN